MGDDFRVVYDYRVFDGQVYGGISRYFVKLATNLRQYVGCDVKVVAPLFKNGYLDELSRARMGRDIVRGFKTSIMERHERYRRILNRTLTDLYAEITAPDIYHKTYYDGKWPRRCKAKKVITIHDLIYERNRGEFDGVEDLMSKIGRELNSADLVICVSKNTRRDLLGCYGVDEKKVVVIHHGVESYEAVTRCPLEKPDERRGPGYILYVGKRDGYKNFKTLVEAWSSSKILKDHFEIRCFGGGPIGNDERDEWRDAGANTDKIVPISGDDRDLYDAYKNAYCFVYPSRYEGFGIPPLEAMACGCPVVCANNSAIPEIVGDAGVYFDADSGEELRACLEDEVSSEDKRRDLVKRGLERVEAFTWKRCAEETFREYKKLGAR